MKKISCMLCLVMLISLMLPIFSISGTAASMPSIHGDVDGDGFISPADASAVAEICAGTKAVPASGSAAFNNANVTGSDIDMEDARCIARAARGFTTYESLYSSASAANAALISYVNAIINQVKTSNFKSANNYIMISSESSSTSTENIEVGYISSVTGKYVKIPDSLTDKLMGEMEGLDSSLAYTAPKTYAITDSNYPINGSSLCSTLSGADVASLSIAVGKGVDVLSALPDSYKIGSRNYDISPYKSKAAALAKCMKITVVLKQETNSTISALGSATSIREKAADSSFRSLINSYPMIQNESSMKMTMNCNGATSDLTFVYYVNASTLLPVAAEYSGKLFFDQSAVMSGNLGIEGMGDISGSMTVKMTTESRDIFLFTGAFS